MADIRQVPKRHLTVEDLLNKYGTRLGMHNMYLTGNMLVHEARLFEETCLDQHLLEAALRLIELTYEPVDPRLTEGTPDA